MKSLKYSEREDMMEGFSPVPPPLPRRQPVRNIYAEPFVDPRIDDGSPLRNHCCKRGRLSTGRHDTGLV
ncbi:hypothetical protein EVAR_67575_1, partial [Eumeta japonica]